MMTSSQSQRMFERWVTHALTHLYDAHALNKSPLGKIFSKNDARKPLATDDLIRKVLLNAIQSVRPGAGTPSHAPGWRTYKILFSRFIEGLSASEVMQKISLSRSHFFAEQARSIEFLCEVLWAEYGDFASETIQAEQQEEAPTPEKADQRPQHEDEVDILLKNARFSPVDLQDLFSEISDLFGHLTKKNSLSLPDREIPYPPIYADRVMLRQVLINILAKAIEFGAPNAPRTEVKLPENFIELSIRFQIEYDKMEQNLAEQFLDTPAIKLSKKIVEALSGHFSFSIDTVGEMAVRLTFPVMMPSILLVVDDDKNYMALFQRYLSGTQWTVMGANDGIEALDFIAKRKPSVISVDVCMPNEDGWGLMHRLKKDPSTRDIPIIVCSALEQSFMATALGADGYLAKPVSKKMLVDALEKVTLRLH